MKLFATILLLIVIIIYFVKMKFSFDKIEGSGNIVSEDRKLIDFQSISLLGSIDVTINYLDAASCTVVGDDNIIKHVKTEVINDKLTISIDKSYSSTKALVVNLSVLNVNELSVSGSGDIKFKNYKDDTLSLKISGSGDILGDGNVEILTGKINGSGDFLLKELHSKSTKININGSGDAELWVSNSLIAKINGSGDINYHGNPKTVESEINGSGEINAD
tara:strand:- start:653 stop:1309 length:657 start_codon:yes stop_codon:yes gene_type:complete